MVLTAVLFYVKLLKWTKKYMHMSYLNLGLLYVLLCIGMNWILNPELNPNETCFQCYDYPNGEKNLETWLHCPSLKHFKILFVVLTKDGAKPIKYGIKLNSDDKYKDIRKPLTKFTDISEGKLLFIELNGPHVKVCKC